MLPIRDVRFPRPSRSSSELEVNGETVYFSGFTDVAATAPLGMDKLLASDDDEDVHDELQGSLASAAFSRRFLAFRS